MDGCSIGAGNMRSLVGWRRSARALVTESEAPESSMKEAMIGASEGVVVGSCIVVAVSE